MLNSEFLQVYCLGLRLCGGVIQFAALHENTGRSRRNSYFGRYLAQPNIYIYPSCRPLGLIVINYIGLDLNCGSFLGQHTGGAVKAGLLEESAIDNAVSNNFATLMRLGFFDGDPRKQQYGKLGPSDVCTPSNQELAQEAARQGIVLLKNTAGSLPLSPSAIKSLAVIGPNANVTKTMIGNYEGNFRTIMVLIDRYYFSNHVLLSELI